MKYLKQNMKKQQKAHKIDGIQAGKGISPSEIIKGIDKEHKK